MTRLQNIAQRLEPCLQGWKANEKLETGGQKENSELWTANDVGSVGKEAEMRKHES